MLIVRLNNVGRKFHKFINVDDLSENETIEGKQVSNNGAFWALRNVYMNVDNGEIIGVIGRNGSGKTTLLNIISGSLPASEGEITIKGKVSALLTLGAGFQEEFTGKENIYLNASLLGMSRQEIEQRFGDIVEFSELGDFINAPLGSYSSGMKMRLGFSVAIYNDFDILVTDEILGVGDMYFQKKCFEKMTDFKKQGKSMIIATQDINIVKRFCSKAILLEDGKVFATGIPEEVVETYQMLLNKKKILSERLRAHMVTETKRWATDMQEWGKREGTREAVIKDLVIIDRWGRRIDKIKTGSKITIRVNFSINEEIDNFHFGLAVFREDGVYCYGPNTKLDGLAIEPMHKGDGYFELMYNNFSLAPGIYYFSAAIWDKEEVFAYDYHKGMHNINVTGDLALGQLSNLPNKWHNSNFLANLDKMDYPDLTYFTDKWSSQINTEIAAIESIISLNNYNCHDNIFVTGRDFKVKTNFKIENVLDDNHKFLTLWIGLYRSDGIYCHGSIKKIASTAGRHSEVLVYPELGLLPGGYKISAGIWDPKSNKFLAYSHGIYSFNMISEKHDHGTVYLEHSWDWSIPKGGGHNDR